MVTKGIIKTLDLTGNTCTVRLPLFETAGNDHIIGTATISNTPGSYNGYKEGDVVWVAFEDGSMNSPVVIGKLYLGVEEERKDPRGVLNVENSTVAKTASMPADTKLSVQTDHNIPNTTSPFSSLSSIANNLNSLNTTVAQNDRDYGNKFKQVISSVDTLGNEYKSTLEQTDRNIRAEVMNKHNGEESGFGWNLTSEDWTVYQRFSGDDQSISDSSEIWVSSVEVVEQNPFTGKKDVIKSYYTINGVQTDREIKETDSVKPSAIYDKTNGIWKWNDTNLEIKTVNKEAINAKAKNIKKILVANEDGLTVAGTIEAEDGHIGSFTIGEENAAGHSGIYSDDYKDKDGTCITSFKNGNDVWEFNEGTKGVYVGTDGIRLGSTFSVDNEGVVTAKGLRIDLTDEQKNKLKGKTTLYYMYSSDGQNHPAENLDDWKTTIPATPTGSTLETAPYLWTKTVTEYEWIIDGESNYTVSYNVSKVGVNTYSEIQYKLSTSNEDAEVYDDEWSTDIKVPTKTVPYVWTRTITYYSDTNEVKSIGDSSLYDSFDSLISILSVDGIDIISSTGTGTNKEYHLKADTLNGAVSDQVTIGGFNIGERTLTAGSGSGAFTIQTNSDLLNYTPADYIESNGKQYIDTGVVMDYTTDAFEIVVQPTVAAHNGMVFGRWNNAENEAALYHYNDNGDIRFYAYGSHGSQQNIPSGILTSDLAVHTYRIENSELFVDNKGSVGKLSYTIPASAFTSYIFAANGLVNVGYKGRIYSCKIWRNGALIRNFKPALKDGDFCLYDACTDTFYKNIGTGRFTGKMTANEGASSFNFNGVRYTRLDYIQNTVQRVDGNYIGNYIDTGITLDFGTGFTVEATFLPTADTTSESRCCLLSNYAGGAEKENYSNISLEIHNNNRARMYLSSLSKGDGKPDFSTEAWTVSTSTKSTVKYSYKNGKATINLNGTATHNTQYQHTGGCGDTLQIFTDRSYRFSTFNVPFKLYSMKIQSGDTIIANLVPVLNESTNKAGLINLVDGRFLPSLGTGHFSYDSYTGDGSDYSGLIFDGKNGDTNSYRVLEYIENTGAQYIDTNVAPTANMISEISFTFLEGSSEHAIFGSTWAADGYFLMAHEDKLKWHSKGKAGYADSLSPGNTYVCKCGPDYFEVNGKQYSLETTSSETESDSTDPIKLLSSLGYTNADGIIKCRIKSFKLWNGTALVRDFIPVIKEESEYGLYDLVEGKFYSNEGTGKFTGKGFAQEFTALYLGAPEAESAPFSVTNTGKMKAISGSIGGFKINSNNLQSANFISNFAATPTSNGVYLGLDGLKLGENFSVDSQGNVIARSLKVGDSWKTFDAALSDASTAGASSAVTTIDGRGYATTTYVDELVAESLAAQKLEVKDLQSNQRVFFAEASSGTVELGGFNVYQGALSNKEKAESINITDEAIYEQSSITDAYSFIADTERDLDNYTAYKSQNAGIDNSQSVMKITIKQDLRKFSIYIGSSAEIGYDYMLASTVNPSSIPTSFDSPYCKSSTSEEYYDVDTGSVLSDYMKVLYTDLKQGDIIYIVYRKDVSVHEGSDTGWVLLPTEEMIKAENTSSSIVGQANSIWITPDGGVGEIGGNTKLNWGITLGENFGVDLNGVLTTANANIKGTITANNGNIGGFTISEGSGLQAEGLDILPGKISLAKSTNQLTIGTTSSYPYLDFEGEGRITGNSNSCGFIFTGENFASATNYRARVHYSYSNPSFDPVTINVTIQEKNASGEWVTSTNGLLKKKSFKLRCQGRANLFDSADQIWYPTVTIAKGSSSGSVSSGGGWFNFKSAVHDSNKSQELEFTQYASSTGVVKSLGSIIPSSTTNTSTLGTSDYRWNKVWAKDITSTNTAVADSDKNLKTNINYDLTPYDDLFDNLKPASYQFSINESGRTHLGLIAQDVEESYFNTNLTRKDFGLLVIDGPGFDSKKDRIVNSSEIKYGLRYGELHALEIRQIQLLKQRVTELEEKIEKLTKLLEK